MLPQGFGNFPSVFSRERWRNLAIKSMMVDSEVDATLDDDFYYYCFFYSQKELSFTRSYLQIFFLKKAINGCGISEHLYSFREVRHLQGCYMTLWMGI